MKTIEWKSTFEEETGVDVEKTCWFKSPENYLDDDLKYQNWFDTCESVKSAFSRGHIDFYSKILSPDIYQLLGDPRDKTSLEIGFGGGRLINAASHVFKRSVGIDVLSKSCIEKTRSFMDNENVSLLNYKDMEEILDNSIDFAYSFIVFQHFTKIDYFHMYVDMFSRKMKKGAVGVIYTTINDKNNKDYFVDAEFEERECSLFYNPRFVKSTLEEKEFKVIEMRKTTKSPWTKDLSKQFCTKFIKA